jgi:hypothetical protein
MGSHTLTQVTDTDCDSLILTMNHPSSKSLCHRPTITAPFCRETDYSDLLLTEKSEPLPALEKIDCAELSQARAWDQITSNEDTTHQCCF